MRKTVQVARQRPGPVETGAWQDEATGRLLILSPQASEVAAGEAQAVLAPSSGRCHSRIRKEGPPERLLELKPLV